MVTVRSVVITGTSTGIGRAAALRLAGNGFRVFASVRRQEDADALVEEARGNLTPLVFDITDDETRDRAVAQVEKEVGAEGLGGLVNNAGAVVPGPLEFVPLEAFRRNLETNLVGAVALTQRCIPLLRKAKGRIVNIGSAQDRLTPPFFGAYTISKWGMRALRDAATRTPSLGHRVGVGGAGCDQDRGLEGTSDLARRFRALSRRGVGALRRSFRSDSQSRDRPFREGVARRARRASDRAVACFKTAQTRSGGGIRRQVHDDAHWKASHATAGRRRGGRV